MMGLDDNQLIYWMRLIHGKWKLHIAATKDGLCFIGSHNKGFEELAVWAIKRLPKHELAENPERMNPYADELIGYLEGAKKEFSLPIDLHGTPFQMEVWQALQGIPYGSTVSYSEIAERIGKPGSVRAVGNAIGANPVLINVPCHRVIAKNGAISGYRGGVEMKELLLALEHRELDTQLNS